MNNNNTTNIQEAKICCQCMTFYANPKFGEFCSKCFSERKSSIDENSLKVETEMKIQTIEPPKTNENVLKQELIEKEKEVEIEIEKDSRPIQV